MSKSKAVDKNLIVALILLLVSMLFAGFALFAGSQGGEQSYEMSGKALSMFVKIFPAFGKLSYDMQMFYIRRLAHVFVYSGMGFFFSGWAFRAIRNKVASAVVAVMGPLAVSLIDELVIQVGASGRNGTIKDVLFDMIFVVIAAVVAKVVAKR